jgi:hypothetical protein
VGLRAQDPQVALQQALCAATTINLESAAHIGALLAGAQSDTIRLIAEAVAANREGRTILNVVNALKLDERLLDAEVTCMEFEELIAHPDTTETMAHNFLKANPWLFGLDYLQTATNVALIRGEADFLLRRSDGFLDLVELKSPDSDIIIERNGGHPTGRNPPPSNFHLSPALANAIAQAHLYRNQMTVEGDALRRQQNIKNTADPRIKIVIGRRANLNDWQSRVLDELNKSLHVWRSSRTMKSRQHHERQ